jgi:hypothetical protein
MDDPSVIELNRQSAAISLLRSEISANGGDLPLKRKFLTITFLHHEQINKFVVKDG